MILRLLTSPLRLLRWAYVAPRLVLIFVLLCLSEVGFGWAAGWLLESHGSAVVGARVEIDGSRASLLKTRVTLTGIQVANPDDPMTNLVEADQLDLKLDAAAALRRKVVVEHGTLRGLRIGGERTTSGALEPSESTNDDNSLRLPAWVGSAAADKAQQWLSELESQLSMDVVEGLQTPSVAERLRADWPDLADQLRADATALQQRVEQLETKIRQAQQNPLRGLETLRQAPAEISSLAREAARLRDVIGDLPQQAASDRRQLAAARRHDEELLRDRLSVDNLDPETISAYLLGERLGGPVGQLVGMLRWARGALPAGQDAAPSTPTRGVEVGFGSRRRPDLLVKRIDVQGSARIEDRPIEIVGLLTNFTTQPTLHAEPLELRVAATGGLPFELHATLDRTGPQPRDTVVAHCGSLPIPALRLGGEKWLNLESPASTASLAINLQLVGDRLQGDLQLVQDDFSIRPATDLQNASPTDWAIADALGESMSETEQVTTTVRLGGDLCRPSYEIKSTLGSVIAGAVRQTLQKTARSRAESLLADSRRRAETELAKLDETIASLTADLDRQLRGQTDLLQRLAGLASPGKPGSLAAPGLFGQGGIFNLGARPKGQPR